MKNHKFIYLGILVLGLLSPTIGLTDTLSDSWASAECGNDDDDDDDGCTGSCTKNSDAEITLTNNSATYAGSSFITDNCSETPDSYRIRFYKVGLCETDPLLNGDIDETIPTTSCFNFFDKSTDTTDAGGTVITLNSLNANDTITADTALITNREVSTVPASYTYAYAILSNMLEIKHTEFFASNVVGEGSLNGGICWTLAKATTLTNETTGIRGNTAVINPSSDSALYTVKCGGTDLYPNRANPHSTYDYTKFIIDDLSGDHENEDFFEGEPEYRIFTDNNGTDLGGKWTALLMQPDNLTLATSANNAFRIFYAIELENPIVIDETTTQFEMSFIVSNAANIEFVSNGSNNLSIKRLSADPFQIKFTVQ